jgi:hypothetical protein
VRVTAVIAGLLAAAAAAVLVQGIFGSGREGAPGFTGVGVLIADVNLALQAALVAGLTFGWYLARRGSIEAHRLNQTVWVLVNTALVVLVMFGSMQDVKLESAADLGKARAAVTWLHALVGTLTAAAGLWLVLQMNDILPRRLQVAWWKNLMRLTLAGYWASALLGLGAYYTWYAG